MLSPILASKAKLFISQKIRTKDKSHKILEIIESEGKILYRWTYDGNSHIFSDYDYIDNLKSYVVDKLQKKLSKLKKVQSIIESGKLEDLKDLCSEKELAKYGTLNLFSGRLTCDDDIKSIEMTIKSLDTTKETQ